MKIKLKSIGYTLMDMKGEISGNIIHDKEKIEGYAKILNNSLVSIPVCVKEVFIIEEN